MYPWYDQVCSLDSACSLGQVWYVLTYVVALSFALSFDCIFDFTLLMTYVPRNLDLLLHRSCYTPFQWYSYVMKYLANVSLILFRWNNELLYMHAGCFKQYLI